MERLSWVDRKFELGIPPGWMPNVIARLAGTEVRMRSIVEGLSEMQLKYQPKGTWSIKQHIGHLGDLEALHDGRIDDFIARAEVLRPADMSNKLTESKDHNEVAITDLIKSFSLKRSAFIRRLKALDDPTQQHVALHPRLQKKMRVVDMAYFTAEHDDHHLASVMEICSRF